MMQDLCETFCVEEKFSKMKCCKLVDIDLLAACFVSLVQLTFCKLSLHQYYLGLHCLTIVKMTSLYIQNSLNQNFQKKYNFKFEGILVKHENIQLVS